jgi:hypothetical protein
MKLAAMRHLGLVAVASLLACRGAQKSASDGDMHPGSGAGSFEMGGPGCGLAAAAFCDTFAAPASERGRAGELDPTRWSAGRMHPQGVGINGVAVGVGMAVIPSCRAGIADHVWPDDDALICDANGDLDSTHLLVATAAQNYGQNGYRIRQPFDFAGRTGKIVFDATVDPLGGLLGWLSLAVTEAPIAVPSFALQGNYEGTVIPKNALEVHFQANSVGALTVGDVHVFKDYADTVYAPDASLTGASYRQHKMNHFEVLISEQQIEIHISPSSDDGVTFGAPALVFKVDAPLPFSRGYVQLSLHNHATLKYSGPGKGFGADTIVDASVARVDNVGFDGPVVSNWREYEAPDSLLKFNGGTINVPDDPYNPDKAGYDVGYVAQGIAAGPKDVIHFKGNVDKSNVVSARVALSSWYLASDALAQYDLMLRLNGRSWHHHPISPEEIALFQHGPVTVDASGTPQGSPAIQGALGQTIDVPVDDLITGDNTIEFQTENIPTNYLPVVLNIDLVLTTN